MIEARYGRSADMRLHDLLREELGLPPRPPVLTPYIDAADEDNEADENDTFAASGAVLVAALDAQPRMGLIPGALVTIVLTIMNDGTLAARNLRAILALPADTTYRPGTFAIDGVPFGDDKATEFLGNGANIGGVEPGAHRTVLLKLLIEAGVGDIALSPHLSATAGAVLGLRAMMLKRAAPPARSVVPERPFYESDPDESAEALAEPTNPRTITVLQPAEFPPLIIAVPENEPAFVVKPPRFGPPRVAPTGPRTVPEHRAIARADATTVSLDGANLAANSVEDRLIAVAESTAGPMPETTARARIESVRSSEEQVFVTGLGGPVLTVRLDRKRLATLIALFSGPSLGTIAHYLVLNALAATQPLPGDRADDSLGAFVAHQEQLLSRALIATRLGKNPAPGSISAPLPAFPPRIAAYSDRRPVEACAAGEIMLVRALTMSDVIALRDTIADEGAAPFCRAAQLFVGLCPKDIVGGIERERREARTLLTEYAAQASEEIGRIFELGKPGRAPVPFRPTDPSFDEAARRVLAVLEQGLA
jgi:hypothetical protein